MKFLFDYIPIIVFFVAYSFGGIYVATAATMLTSVIQVIAYWVIYKKFEKFHLITLVFVLVFGSLTLLFHNPIYIKWKPTIVYWIFSIVLFSSQFIGSKAVIHRLLDAKISLSLKVWARINFSWGVFFLLLGGLNLLIAYHFDTKTWVYFKLFGTLILMLLFILAQAIYISKHAQPIDKEKEET